LGEVFWPGPNGWENDAPSTRLVRVGHAALGLPCLANEAPTELPKDNNDRLLRFPIWLASLPACVELACHRLLNIAMIHYCASGMIGLCGELAITGHPQLQLHKSEPPGRNRWPPVPGRVFPSDPKEPRSVLRSRVKVFRLFGDLRFRIMQEKGADQTGEPSWVRAQLWRWTF